MWSTVKPLSALVLGVKAGPAGSASQPQSTVTWSERIKQWDSNTWLVVCLHECHLLTCEACAMHQCHLLT